MDLRKMTAFGHLQNEDDSGYSLTPTGPLLGDNTINVRQHNEPFSNSN